MGYYIDIPTEKTITDADGWTNLTTTKTKAEAIAWIRDNIGWCDDEGNICLITEGDTEEGETTETPDDIINTILQHTTPDPLWPRTHADTIDNIIQAAQRHDKYMAAWIQGAPPYNHNGDLGIDGGHPDPVQQCRNRIIWLARKLGAIAHFDSAFMDDHDNGLLAEDFIRATQWPPTRQPSHSTASDQSQPRPSKTCNKKDGYQSIGVFGTVQLTFRDGYTTHITTNNQKTKT